VFVRWRITVLIDNFLAMSTPVYRLITRLGADARKQLFERAGLTPIHGNGLKPRDLVRLHVEAVATADDTQRWVIEGIASQTLAISEKGELAEQALRRVCGPDTRLEAVVEADLSLEERILTIALSEPDLLDRVRNTTMLHHWRDGRFHCEFEVCNPRPLSSEISQAVESIGRIVRGVQRGRRVHPDKFRCRDSDNPERLVDHLAIYLETPASMLMEFPRGETTPQPVLRREARELALEYDAETGRLEIAGKGLGGSKVFRDIAEAFCSQALGDAEYRAVQRQEWELQHFLAAEPPILDPPAGFARARIAEIVAFYPGNPGSKLVIRAGRDQDMADRFRQLRLRPEWLMESVYGITITLEAFPEAEEKLGREVRVTLRRPNSQSFDGATYNDERNIKRWLQSEAFQRPIQTEP
jgi:hypothetical protein